MSDLTVDEWNARYPIGTLVTFDNTGIGGNQVIVARTASEAVAASSWYTTLSKWVVHLEGYGDGCFGGGCISVVELPEGSALGAGAKSDLTRLAESIEGLTAAIREWVKLDGQGRAALDEFWRQAAESARADVTSE
jgi:hypothetical protein